jgi:hypothetical protein
MDQPPLQAAVLSIIPRIPAVRHKKFGDETGTGSFNSAISCFQLGLQEPFRDILARANGLAGLMERYVNTWFFF